MKFGIATIGITLGLFLGCDSVQYLTEPSDPYQRTETPEADPLLDIEVTVTDFERRLDVLEGKAAKIYKMPDEVNDPAAELRLRAINRALEKRARSHAIYTELSEKEIVEIIGAIIEETIAADERREFGRSRKPGRIAE